MQKVVDGIITIIIVIIIDAVAYGFANHTQTQQQITGTSYIK